MSLPAPARYFPFSKGVYDVTPNLKPLGTDFGNGRQDGLVFQLDTEFEKFRQNKLETVRTMRDRSVLQSEFSLEVAKAAVNWMANQLVAEHPEFFSLQTRKLRCGLTGNDIELSADPFGVLDALLMEVQEDVAVVQMTDDRDWTSFVHVCSPSHWAPETKVGTDFVAVHAPVPHWEKIAPGSRGLVNGMIHKGPFVRFVWTLAEDTVLNHHPSISHSPTFEKGEFWIRTERQVLVGLPAVSASLFFIRVAFVPSSELMADQGIAKSLRSNLLSMSPAVRSYKGLAGAWPRIEELVGL
jgi:hypothetical protein